MKRKCPTCGAVTDTKDYSHLQSVREDSEVWILARVTANEADRNGNIPVTVNGQDFSVSPEKMKAASFWQS